MSMEKKASTHYAQNASSDAKAVNLLFTILRLVWATAFFLSAYVLQIFDSSPILSLILVANGLMTFRFVQNMLFKHYGGGKMLVQYFLLIGALFLILTQS